MCLSPRDDSDGYYGDDGDGICTMVMEVVIMTLAKGCTVVVVVVEGCW